MVFGLDSVNISYISTRKFIVKVFAKHAFKAYEFSHFMRYSDSVPSQLPFEREGKFILHKKNSYDNVSINVSDSESEVEDQVESVYHGIEDEVQSKLDPYSIPTPNPRSKRAQKFIEAIGNMTRDS